MSVTLKLPSRQKPWSSASAETKAERVAQLIRDRSLRGISATGRRFKRKANGEPSTVFETGELLDSIKARAEGEAAVVEATADYARYVAEERPFMGLTKSEQRKLARELEISIGERLAAEAPRTRSK